MSRYAEIPITSILVAADRWKQQCLVEQRSLFDETQQVWTPAAFAELEKRYIFAPDVSQQTFIEKLRLQLAPASNAAKLLALDLTWVLYLFPRKIIGPAKKLSNLRDIAAIAQHPLDPQHWALSTEVLSGIGSGGTFFNTGFWWEFTYAIYLFQAWAALPQDQRTALIQPDADLSGWLDGLTMPEKLPAGQPLNPSGRMFRHIFLYLMQPDSYERIASTENKRDIVKRFSEQLKLPADVSSPSRMDEQLRVIRSKLEDKLGSKELDFYIEPLRSLWNDASSPEVAKDQIGTYARGTAPDAIKMPALPRHDDATLADLYGPAPRNVIFHGPPGTGKTHTLLGTVLPAYTDAVSQESAEARLLRQVASYNWFDVIGAAMLDIGENESVAVAKLREHRFIAAKFSSSSSQQNLNQRLWGFLQNHTIAESTTVSASRERRVEPLVFDKTVDSKWQLISGWELAAPELQDVRRALADVPGHSAEQVRRYEMVTFHPSYSYEDFVEGLRPVPVEREGEAASVEIQPVDGALKRISRQARENPGQRYALVIDEINRGNIAKIFGELITLIESDKRLRVDAQGHQVNGIELRLPYTGELFGVPENLDFYGTMNTADRSIALVDIALRRRFVFRELMPDATAIQGSERNGLIVGDDGEAIDLRLLLRVINARIAVLRGRDAMIGHAYLTSVTDMTLLQATFRDKIIPLLQEHFFEDWERINQVLAVSGSAQPFLVAKRPNLGALFAGKTQGLDDADEALLWQISPALPAASFRAIYEGVPESELDL